MTFNYDTFYQAEDKFVNAYHKDNFNLSDELMGVYFARFEGIDGVSNDIKRAIFTDNPRNQQVEDAIKRLVGTRKLKTDPLEIRKIDLQVNTYLHGLARLVELG